jgi:hypothetical protein
MSFPTTGDTLCELGLPRMSFTMEQAYTIMNGNMTSIVIEVINSFHLDVTGSEILLEECNFCHHNFLGRQQYY